MSDVEQGHPAVAGREAELRALSNAVRRLVAATVTNTASAEETGTVADELDALAARLEQGTPGPPPPRFLTTPAPDLTLSDRMPYDVVVGPFNPLAPPLEISFEPPGAIGRAVLGTPYEGPPGCIHGGVIASMFDMVLSAATMAAGVAGPTARLTVRYRRPTLLHRDLTIEAWVTHTTGRRTTTGGRILQGGEVTAEAEGLFVVLGRQHVMRLGERAAGGVDEPL